MESVNKKKISADIALSIQELNIKIVVAKKLGLTVEIERFSTSENRIIKLNSEDNLICFQVYEHITYSPQHIPESLANGLTSKPIEPVYPKVSKKKFNKTMKNYYKSLEAMGIKRDSGNRQG